jgi:ubiquinone/menaquinone biosynthesis C-methylase UbiE
MMQPMSEETLVSILHAKAVAKQNGIFVTREIADRTVWDDLAIENPTEAVISAPDEVAAEAKSIEQINDILRFLRAGDVLLDVGCGYGRVAQYLLPALVLGGYVGVDSSYEMLSLFKRRYESREEEQRTPVMFINADIHTIPLTDASVDAVIVCAVFLHNHKSIVARALAEIKRILKPGGVMLVYSSFPRGATLMGVQGYGYQALLNVLGQPYKNGPVRYYRSREIKALLEGFSDIQLRPVGYSVLPKTIIGLPQPLERWYRLGIAVPSNQVLARLTPRALLRYLAVHYDVIARR